MQRFRTQALKQTTCVPTWLYHHLLARWLDEFLNIAPHLKMRITRAPHRLVVAIKLLNISKGLGQYLGPKKKHPMNVGYCYYYILLPSTISPPPLPKTSQMINTWSVNTHPPASSPSQNASPEPFLYRNSTAPSEGPESSSQGNRAPGLCQRFPAILPVKDHKAAPHQKSSVSTTAEETPPERHPWGVTGRPF